jgi:peptidoglycan LD-endopeptidase LytH
MKFITLNFTHKTYMFLNSWLIISSLLLVKADQNKPSFGSDSSLFVKYKQMLVNIREQKISPDSARTEFKTVMSKLREFYPNHSDDDSALVFPLTKSNLSAVGGKGNGFYARKFDLFDFTVTGSHPAHDIFIYDPDQDCKDNRKKDYVDIVSVGNGIVLAVEQGWTVNSKFKGGNYVWVYDILSGSLWYYAHLREVAVNVGQIIEPGNKLGQVGRTGSSAMNPRSDTHLHLMHLRLNENLLPKAHNYYPWLKKAKFLNASTEANYNNKIDLN